VGTLNVKISVFADGKNKITHHKEIQGSIWKVLFHSFFHFMDLFLNKLDLEYFLFSPIKIKGGLGSQKIISADVWLVIFSIALNITVFSWLMTKHVVFAEEFNSKETIKITEDATKEGLVKLNDLNALVPIEIKKKEEIASVKKVPENKNTSDENSLIISLSDEKCVNDKSEKRNSELCGKDQKDEKLEKELANMDKIIRDLSTKKQNEAIQKAVRGRAPQPYVYAKDILGRKVCNKKNDKPHKSNKKDHKPGHMDMECCLDPDETPNPNCYYDPEKYGKYLK